MTLKQWFKLHAITPRKIAEDTDLSYGYVIELLNGTTPFTDSARAKFLRAFPELLVDFPDFLEGGDDETHAGTMKA